MRTRLIAVFAATLLTFASAPLALADDYKLGWLVIDHPHARATPPNAPVSGGFMVIKNTGTTPDRLVGGSTTFSAGFQVHEMKMDGDVMMMRPVEGGLEIPVGGQVEFKPGGYHIMFTGLFGQLKPGEKRKARLVFENAGEIEVEFDVEDMKPGLDRTGHNANGASE